MPALDPAKLADPSSNDEVLDAFLGYLVEGIEPYDHQEEAILELFDGTQRDPQHADRVGEIAGGAGAAVSGDLPGAALVSTPCR